MIPPASGPGAFGYHGVAQKGLWYPTAPWCGAGGRTVVSREGTVRPPAPGRGVCVGPLVRLRGESGPASLVCVSEGNVDPQAFRIKQLIIVVIKR